jgi:Uncharacterized conserved small protein
MTSDEQRRKNIEEAAQRAKAEAKLRADAQKEAEFPKELGGRNGPEPTRFGDWELKGITL